MALNKNYILDTPKYQGTNLPTLDDFGGDVPKYMAALKAAYEADTNNSAPAYAAPGSFTTPDGQQMSSAGYHLDKSAGELAADAYNRIMQRAAMSQVKGPSVGLTAQSRMSVRPDEAALAFNAYKLGESGLPEFQLNPYMANLMEAYGMRSPAKPENTPGFHNGGPGVTPGGPGRPVDPGEVGGKKPGGGGESKLQPISSPVNGGLDPISSPSYGGSPAIPGAGFPLPGEYPSIGYNPPSSVNMSGGVPDWLVQLGSKIDSSHFDMSKFPSLPKGGDFAPGGGPYANNQPSEPPFASQLQGGGGNYPPGLLQALNNHRSPTGGVGY